MEKKMIENQLQLKNPNELNPLTLAYVGDAIYELFIRQHVVAKGGKPNILHRRTISYVSSKAQAKIIHGLLPILNEKEQEIVRRGRNAKSYTTPKNANMIDYRYSTAFEALIGFLYLSNENERLKELIKMAINYIEQDGETNGK